MIKTSKERSTSTVNTHETEAFEKSTSFPNKMWPKELRCDSLVAQMVKCLPTMWETQVQFPSQEDPLEKAMAPHSSTLAWKIPWMEEPARLQSMGLQRVGYDWVTNLSFFSLYPQHGGEIFSTTRHETLRICLPSTALQKTGVWIFLLGWFCPPSVSVPWSTTLRKESGTWQMLRRKDTIVLGWKHAK